MCVDFTQNPQPSPGALRLPGDVTISFELRSSTPTRVTVIYSSGPGLFYLVGGQRVKEIIDRDVPVDLFQFFQKDVHLVPRQGDGHGMHVMNVRIMEAGCPPQNRPVGVTGLAPAPLKDQEEPDHANV